MKRIKRGLFSGFWHAMIEVPTDAMVGNGDNNPFPYLFANIIQQARGGPDAPDAVDTQFIKVISDISGKLDKALPGGPLGALLKILILGSTVPTIVLEAAKVYTKVNVERPLEKLMRPELMGAMDVISTWREGVIDEKERDDKLATLGIPDDEMKALVEISDANPRFADLVNWYHCGAYKQSADSMTGSAERLADFKALVGPSLLRSGVDLQDVDALWHSHWQVPGFQQAIQWMQRGLVKRSDIDALLDRYMIHPKWRESMIKGSYSLYPIRSITSMLRLGILSDDEAIQEFRAHGYDEIKASKMLAWSKAQIEQPTVLDAPASPSFHAKQRDITQGQLLSAYGDGLIPRDQAKRGLGAMGFGDNEAELILQGQDHSKLQANTREALTNLKDLYLNAQVEESDATSIMGKLGLPGNFATATLEKWKQQAALNIALPDKGDILRFYEKGIIDDSTATVELARLGFTPEWIAAYLDAHEPKAPKARG